MIFHVQDRKERNMFFIGCNMKGKEKERRVTIISCLKSLLNNIHPKSPKIITIIVCLSFMCLFLSNGISCQIKLRNSHTIFRNGKNSHTIPYVTFDQQKREILMFTLKKSYFLQ